MEAIFGSLLSALGQNGAPWILVSLLSMALAYVYSHWREAEQKCLELSNGLQEKRISERTETIQVLHAGAEANKKLADSIAVRTETLNNLIAVVTVGNDRAERLLSDILRRLENQRAQAG